MAIVIFSGCQLGREAMNAAYPVGSKSERFGSSESTVTISRYGELPIIFYVSAGQLTGRKLPAVVFSHGRPFQMPGSAVYGDGGLAGWLNEQGIAVAFPIRSGYHQAVGSDFEVLPCGRTAAGDIERAGEAAADDIRRAVAWVEKQPMVDTDRVFLAGTSAGGFASIYAIGALEKRIRGVISLNGARCGARSDAVDGLPYLKEIYERIALRSSIPVLFLAGGVDQVVPLYTSRELFKSFCAGRDRRCAGTVRLLINEGGDHGVRGVLLSNDVREAIVKLLTRGEI
jgi:dipeptidyl aminopeptidase/acylaminoacyl peptidase